MQTQAQKNQEKIPWSKFSGYRYCQPADMPCQAAEMLSLALRQLPLQGYEKRAFSTPRYIHGLK
ncbi:MAG TPA: hypothetical protein VJH95_05110 [Candidatus Nanoarchaeia archaeon]|nr:hypothetical protein [Candidatus Nanoarchaeia archaeon]